MAKLIKVKESKNHVVNVGKEEIRTKDSIVSSKEKAEQAYGSNDSTNEYASDKAESSSKRVTEEVVDKFAKSSSKSIKETKDNIVKTKARINKFKIKLAEGKKIKVKGNAGINKAVKSTKVVASKSTKATKSTVVATKRGKKLAQETLNAGYKGVRAVLKGAVSAIKGIIAGTKALIAAIIAGGSIAVSFVVIICLVGLLVSSIFGIFFSSEKRSDNNRPLSDVIAKIDEEFNGRILDIQESTDYNVLVINENRAEWKYVLSIYVARLSNGTNEIDVITIDDSKIKILEEIFWDMNSISSYVEVEELIDKEADIKIAKKTLFININGKSVEVMMDKYNFSDIQKEQVSTLLSDEYASMWTSVIYGISIGTEGIVQIALSQVGNVGGETYWRWYGLNYRAEWCAIFVSWAANEAGYIDAGIIPKFAYVPTGEYWFKERGLWKNKGYIPKPGDIIFFDWEVDGKVNHVGIVEKVENGKIYTIEGNSTGDMCRRLSYSINSKVIYGFGTPEY